MFQRSGLSGLGYAPALLHLADAEQSDLQPEASENFGANSYLQHLDYGDFGAESDLHLLDSLNFGRKLGFNLLAKRTAILA